MEVMALVWKVKCASGVQPLRIERKSHTYIEI